jgi:SAM-dependent methyltransferase
MRDRVGREDRESALSSHPMKLLRLAVAIAILAAPLTAQKRLRSPDVKYVPSPQSVVDAMLQIAHVTAADIVYDLGSGDGRIPITAAQRYGARAVGVELEPRLVAEASDNAKKAGVAGRVWFVNQDLFETDFSDATVVTLFLMPRLNQQLIPKLKALRPGARVVSHMWDMGPDWPPDQTQDVSGLMIYLWTIR